MKIMGKLLRFLTSRLFVTGIVLILQVLWFVLILLELGSYSTLIRYLFIGISILVVLVIVNEEYNPAYKLAWVVPILLVPFLGGLLYITLGSKKPMKRLRQKLEKQYKATEAYMVQDKEVYSELAQMDPHIASQCNYMVRSGNFPVFKNTVTDYYKSGEENFVVIKEEMEKAKHYIFLEYFIISSGKMWGEMLEIMERKVKEGLDVRLIYDDIGCLGHLPMKYAKIMEEKGIRCFAFNPYVPVFSAVMNNRDHRKILVIDGHTAFTGGINLADEYINEKSRFGYWKDTGIRLKGDAAWSLTMMFLQTWNAICPTDTDFNRFLPHTHHIEGFDSDGFVQPYGDTPLDSETLSESVYLNIINQAKNYVYIFTPYLIIDNEMITSLTMAAKRGVDVRIVVPGIPDKKYVFIETRSYCPVLMRAGIRIYEYTPGFLHAKSFVCDDEVATVGTVNMDFRSLYLHFECGVYLYKTKAVMQVKEDAMNVFSVSHEITSNDCKEGFVTQLTQAVIRLFAPLM